MKRLILALCLIATPAMADPRFHETQPLRIEANITTVSSMTMTDQGQVLDQGQPVDIQPTITVDEANGPTQDGAMILVKTIREDF